MFTSEPYMSERASHTWPPFYMRCDPLARVYYFIQNCEIIYTCTIIYSAVKYIIYNDILK